ncbi:MAG: aminopeptidase P family protein [Clostridia bacterium]|nr:aminopeptidase P family protein [Clostridia bacterium]
MQASFYQNNRKRLAEKMKDGSVALFFSGFAPRKRADEDYPFFSDRNFVYLTGIARDAGLILMIKKEGGKTAEKLYLLPPDLLKERWTGRRTKADEAQRLSGIEEIGYTADFEPDFAAAIRSAVTVCLDLDTTRAERDYTEAHRFAARLAQQNPAPEIENSRPILAALRTIKADCEIAAMREAVRITGDGIRAMMRGVRDGMKEYEIKMLYDNALVKNGCLEPGFPSIISAGKNNFCIHYYAYEGTAHDGDMVLCDVGACYDFVGCDISRGFPLNGKFSEKQRLLYTAAYETSQHLFSTIKPGYPMEEVDREAKRFCYEYLHDYGLVDRFENIGKLMWHGGSHHVGFDTHDIVVRPEFVAPGMVFCVDIGIYCEEWGIGFRVEDNCLVTPDGCENLGVNVPRTIGDIEAEMKKG